MLSRLQMTLSRLKRTITFFIASLHASEDNVLPFEDAELDADDDLNEREDKTDKHSNRPKRSRRTAPTAFYFIKRLTWFVQLQTNKIQRLFKDTKLFF